MNTPSSTSPTFTPSDPFSYSSSTSLRSDSPEKFYPGRLPDSGILQGSTTSNTVDYLAGFEQPEKIIGIIEMLFDNLDNSYKQIENPGYKNELQKRYEKMKIKLKESREYVITATRSKAIEKEKFVERLKTFEDKFTFILNNFENQTLNEIFEEFNTFAKEYYNLLKEVQIEIQNSIKNTESSQVLSKNDAPSQTTKNAFTHAMSTRLGSDITTTILDNFIQDAQKEEKNYPQLIQAYVNSLYQFRLLKDKLQLCRYIDDIVKPLQELQLKLDNQKVNLEQIFIKLDLICPQYPNNQHNKTELKTFLTNMVQYTKNYISFYDQDINVIEINELKNQYLKDAERITTEITVQINKIKTRYNDILNLYDKDTQNNLLQQNINAINNLYTLQNTIINEWNRFCLDLYELNNHRAIFDAIEPIDKKIGWSYVLTKSIQDRLFKKFALIKDETEKTKVFNELKAEYVNLCKFIKYSDNKYGLKKGNPDYEPIIENILEIDEDLINPFVIFEILPSYNPNKTDCDKTLLTLISDFCKIPDNTHKTPYGALSNGWMVLDNSLNDVEQELDREKRAKEIGVVWNDVTKNAVIKRCEEKKNEYHQMLTTKKAQSCKAYNETLSQACNSTAHFINLMGKELIELKHYKQSDSKAKNEKSLTKYSTPTEEIETFEEVKSPFHDDFDLSKL